MVKILSLIVPAYNMEAYLPRCLDSLSLGNQKHQTSLEVVIVNDGSCDRTSAVAHEFQRRFPDVIRVIDKKNGHYGSCINAALEIVTGEFVKILEPDDVYNASDFAKFVSDLKEVADNRDLNVDLVITDYASIDAQGSITGVKHFLYQERTALTFDEFQKTLSYHVLLPAVTYRTNIFRCMDYHQSEGCPYTDLEWLTYPMHLVRSAYYLPYSIYRYFIGREDQSVNPANFKKGIGVIAKLMMRMLNDYQQLIDPSRPAVEAYVRKVISAQIQQVYHSYLIDRNAYLNRNDLLALDDLLKDRVPALHRSIDPVLHSNRFDFHYVREFRRAQSRNTWRFSLLMFYSWIAQRFG